MEKIKNLIEKKESQTLEFKSKMEDGLGKSICSFANTNDGIILVGVSDDGKVNGIDKKHEKEIANIAHSCKPSIYPKIETVELDGKNVFIVKVKKSDSLHSFKNIAYKRIASHNKPLSPEEVIEFAKYSGKIRWDEQICEEGGLDYIDWKFVKEFFIPLYEKTSEKKIAGKPINLLESLSCIKNNKPTNAGILLFGKNPQGFFRNAYIAMARYKGNTIGGEKLDYKEFTGNLFQQIDNCNQYILEHIALMSRLIPGEVRRKDISEYGKFSIRELTTNSICHRDYENQGGKIIIKMFYDKIEFYNIGSLPAGITPQNIMIEQYSRNSTIANILAKVEYIEELGEGWDKIMREHKEHPLKPKMPKIESSKNSTLVTLFSTKEKFEMKKDVLDKRQKKIINFIEKNGKITTTQCADLLNVSNDTAFRELSKIMSIDLIKKKGIGRGIYYVIE